MIRAFLMLLFLAGCSSDPVINALCKESVVIAIAAPLECMGLR